MVGFEPQIFRLKIILHSSKQNGTKNKAVVGIEPWTFRFRPSGVREHESAEPGDSCGSADRHHSHHAARAHHGCVLLQTQHRPQVAPSCGRVHARNPRRYVCLSPTPPPPPTTNISIRPHQPPETFQYPPHSDPPPTTISCYKLISCDAFLIQILPNLHFLLHFLCNILMLRKNCHLSQNALSQLLALCTQ